MQNTDFPEHWFPVRVISESAYLRRVEAGKKLMKSERAAICGLARDVGPTLPRTIRNIEALGSMFKEYRVFIYENDSIDNTLNQLNDWHRGNSLVQILSETKGHTRFGQVQCLDRAAHLASYRNVYLTACRSDPIGFDTLIVVDTDLEGGWSLQGICTSFSYKGWDAIGSQGLFYRANFHNGGTIVQFDVWAFREVGRSTPHRHADINRMLWHRGSGLIPVWSCFGGMAIYRFASVGDALYTGIDCEHVTLHEKMRMRGNHCIFLNPNQITLYNDIPPNARNEGPYHRPDVLAVRR